MVSIKSFFNNKKIPLIPPLFHENKFVTDYKEKVELFNAFFAKQCSLVNNSSKLPSHLHYLTDNRLSSVSFSQDGIDKIIQNLDPNKAHDHDNISIRMLKICGSSIYKPRWYSSNALTLAFFLLNGKRVILFPFTEKEKSKTIENYRPVSLVPFCGKILERLLSNQMFNFFIENKLISSNQSGFKPGDSYINQLLPITHEINKSFDVRPEVRSVFLDMSCAARFGTICAI